MVQIVLKKIRKKETVLLNNLKRISNETTIQSMVIEK